MGPTKTEDRRSAAVPPSGAGLTPEDGAGGARRSEAPLSQLLELPVDVDTLFQSLRDTKGANGLPSDVGLHWFTKRHAILVPYVRPGWRGVRPVIVVSPVERSGRTLRVRIIPNLLPALLFTVVWAFLLVFFLVWLGGVFRPPDVQFSLAFFAFWVFPPTLLVLFLSIRGWEYYREVDVAWTTAFLKRTAKGLPQPTPTGYRG